MEITKEEIRKNRGIAIVITSIAFSFLLLTFFLKKVVPEAPKAEQNSLLFSFGMNEENNNSNPTVASAAVSKADEQKSETKAELKSELTEQESLISSYKNYKEQVATSSGIDHQSTDESTVTTTGMENTDGLKIDGFGFVLENRGIIVPPIMPGKSKEQGKVVVDIAVDSDGNVIEARPGSRGTTSNSTELWTKAKNTALSIKFSKSSRAEQRGTISIIFTFE